MVWKRDSITERKGAEERKWERQRVPKNGKQIHIRYRQAAWVAEHTCPLLFSAYFHLPPAWSVPQELPPLPTISQVGLQCAAAGHSHQPQWWYPLSDSVSRPEPQNHHYPSPSLLHGLTSEQGPCLKTPAVPYSSFCMNLPALHSYLISIPILSHLPIFNKCLPCSPPLMRCHVWRKASSSKQHSWSHMALWTMHLNR